MYAQRFNGRDRFNPGGLAAAVGINAAVVAALLVAAPHVTRIAQDPPLVGTTIELAPPPDPPPPKPRPREEARASAPRPDAPETIVKTPPTAGLEVAVDPVPTRSDFGTAESGTGTGVAVDPPALPRPPLLVAPGIDPRYAGDLQPDYPPAERRQGNAGKVTVRVLVGADGRVRQVERVSASSDAFYRATEAQALRRWRFRPGTRDGVAEAAWRTMTVTFVMED